jgi:hypothetical protein
MQNLGSSPAFSCAIFVGEGSDVNRGRLTDQIAIANETSTKIAMTTNNTGLSSIKLKDSGITGCAVGPVMLGEPVFWAVGSGVGPVEITAGDSVGVG